MPTNNTRGLWRGKRLNNGEWVLGCLIRSSSKAMIFVLDDKTNRISGTDVDPSTLGECTGLRDKNGKLIFEGDIISFVEIPEKYYVAKWDKENACFYFDRDVYVKACFAPQHGIIVGNIHDNPELLEGADKP